MQYIKCICTSQLTHVANKTHEIMLYQHITAVVTQALTCLSTCSEVAAEVFCLKAASNPGGGEADG